MSLPAILYIRDLRRLLGWDADRIRRHLQKHAIARVDAFGLTYTTPTLINDVMPDVHRAMDAKWSAMQVGGEVDPDDFADLV